jgi:histone acetyltransferase
MMTYADNLALGYFRKQGFTREWRMAAERWRGYIKDYEGGTLVECQIHPAVDYARISDIIRAQKEAVLQAVRAVSINHITFPAPPHPAALHRTTSTGEVEHFRVDPMLLPGVREAGWSWAEHEELMKTRQLSFLLECQHVLELVKKHQAAWPFREAVSLADVPDYTAVVKDPVDLKTIETRLAANQYPDKLKFCADVDRLFSNCKLYNQPETMYYKCAVELEEYTRPHLQALREESLQAGRLKARSEKRGKRRE